MRKKIVVCDDDEAILDVVTDILKDEGYEVHSFNDCSQIAQIVKDFTPDLIILDIWMPKVNVKDTVGALKANASSKNIPVLLISALNEGETISKELKVSGFIRKPFNVEDLISVVKKKIR